MTTPNIPAVTDEQRRLARDWAELVESHPDTWTERLRAAARVLLAVLPRPTLADMTSEERAECQRMQADVKGYEHPAVILQTYVTNGSARVMWETLRVEEVAWANITPRPDLPRLQWPGDKNPAPAPDLPDGWRLADHPDYGRVVVTNDTPNRHGHVCVAYPDAKSDMWHRWALCDPNRLTYLDTDNQTTEET